MLESYEALRQGQTPQLEEAMPLRAFLAFERAQAAAAGEAEKFWLAQFAGELPVLELPLDHPRPARQTFAGGRVSLTIDTALTSRLKQTATRQRASLFMVVFAAYNVLLHRLTGQPDVIVGAPFEGEVRALEGGARLYANTTHMLPLRSRIPSGERFADYLEARKQLVLEASEQQDYFFGRLLAQLRVGRDPSRSPLFSAAFNFENADFCQQLPGLEITAALETWPHRTPGGMSMFEVNLNIAEQHGALVCQLDHAEMFEPETARRWLSHFRTLLAAIADAPETPLEALPMVSADEEAQLLAGWNQTARDYSARPALLHELFTTQAKRTPGAPSVSDERRTLTYAELDQASTDLAATLVSGGAGPDVLIGIHLERSVEMVVAVLAVLKAGSAYVPLDTTYPPERIAYMIGDARMPLIVTDSALAGALPETTARILLVDSATQQGDARSAGAAGSTGLQAGGRAVLQHRIISPTSSTRRVLPASRRGSWSRTAPSRITCIGCRTISRSRQRTAFCKRRHFPSTFRFGSFSSRSRRGRNSSWHARAANAIAPTCSRPCNGAASPCCKPCRRCWRCWWPSPRCPQRSACVFSFPAAKLCRAALADRFLAARPDCALVNLYGPTECTVYASAHRCRPGEAPVPIGRPVANTRYYILDRQRQPAPMGVPGELHIGGVALARGYWRNAEKTDAQFVEFRGERVYKTGDLARWLPSGEVEFLSRLDDQIKLRGFRIELGEIESALRQIPGIGQCAVVARELAPGAMGLVAYYTRNGRPAPPPETMRELLAQTLPGYMVPAWFQQLETFPLTASGKLSMRGLPIPTAPASRSLQEPKNALETQLLEIWHELLGPQPFGTRDNFFELGGHSLLAARMITLIQERFGRKLEFSALFDLPTIEQIAHRLLRDQQAGAPNQAFVAINAEGSRRPFFFMHGDYVGGGFFSKGLARQIGADRPFYAVHPHGLHGDTPPASITAMAADRLAAIRAVQPHGPYLLGGYCNGALVSFEMARLLAAEGEEVAALLMLMADGSNYRNRHWQQLANAVSTMRGEDPQRRQQRFLAWRTHVDFARGVARHYSDAARDLWGQSWRERLPRIAHKLHRVMTRPHYFRDAETSRARRLQTLLQVGEVFGAAFATYIPAPYEGPVTLLWPADQATLDGLPEDYGWSAVSPRVELLHVPGAHHSCVAQSENVRRIGDVMRTVLEAADPVLERPQTLVLA